MWQLDRFFRVDHAGNDETGGGLGGFFQAGGNGKRCVDGNDVEAEPGFTVVLPADGATQARAVPRVFAGEGGVVLVDVGVVEREHAVFGGGGQDGRVFPLGGRRPDPAVLGPEPETVAALIGPGVVLIGVDLRPGGVEQIKRTIG
jgi:hypothetical protein